MKPKLFTTTCYEISKQLTKNYSTSFFIATSLLEKRKRKAIYAVYGFVRLADEIVDSFHGYNQEFLLNKLNEDLKYAIKNNISTNPILVSFVEAVNNYNIEEEHIYAFMNSMKADLSVSKYLTNEHLDEYVYGSANVVGLMCLKIFCDGCNEKYKSLQFPAEKLGSAFQKVNFLRDIKADINELGRIYFPELLNSGFNNESKRVIESIIEQEFKEAYLGIKQLPGRSKLAVAIAYEYYQALLNKIKSKSAKIILEKRIRISNTRKYFLLVKTITRYYFRLI